MNRLWYLRIRYPLSRRQDPSGERDPMAVDPAWLQRVLKTEVELKPAGRAILREPDKPFKVEVQFVLDPEWAGPGIQLIQVVPDQPMDDSALASMDLDLVAYLAALELRFERGPQGSFPRAPRRRPAPGKPLDARFYRVLLDRYELLLQESYRDPAKELARRMGEKHSTVKSWLARGRRYLGERKE